MKRISQTGLSAQEHGSFDSMYTPSRQYTLPIIIAFLIMAFLAFAYIPALHAVADNKKQIKKKKNTNKAAKPKSTKKGTKKQEKPKIGEAVQPKLEKPRISQWSSDINKHPINNLKECQLRSKIQTKPDGVSNIRLVFVFNSKHLFVLTDGNIDTEYKNTGITIKGPDATKRYGFNQISKKTNVVFPNFTRKHINKILAAKSISVTLGFWPTWPKTKPITTSVSLHGFAEAYKEFLMCVNN